MLNINTMPTRKISKLTSYGIYYLLSKYHYRSLQLCNNFHLMYLSFNKILLEICWSVLEHFYCDHYYLFTNVKNNQNFNTNKNIKVSLIFFIRVVCINYFSNYSLLFLTSSLSTRFFLQEYTL